MLYHILYTHTRILPKQLHFVNNTVQYRISKIIMRRLITCGSRVIFKIIDYQCVITYYKYLRIDSVQLVANLTSDEFAFETFSKIDDTFTVNNASYYGADFAQPPPDEGTGHVSVLAPNGDAVAVTSTINTR